MDAGRPSGAPSNRVGSAAWAGTAPIRRAGPAHAIASSSRATIASSPLRQAAPQALRDAGGERHADRRVRLEEDDVVVDDGVDLSAAECVQHVAQDVVRVTVEGDELDAWEGARERHVGRARDRRDAHPGELIGAAGRAVGAHNHGLVEDRIGAAVGEDLAALGRDRGAAPDGVALARLQRLTERGELAEDPAKLEAAGCGNGGRGVGLVAMAATVGVAPEEGRARERGATERENARLDRRRRAHGIARR